MYDAVPAAEEERGKEDHAQREALDE